VRPSARPQRRSSRSIGRPPPAPHPDHRKDGYARALIVAVTLLAAILLAALVKAWGHPADAPYGEWYNSLVSPANIRCCGSPAPLASLDPGMTGPPSGSLLHRPGRVTGLRRGID
jgi:hypothetical protein